MNPGPHTQAVIDGLASRVRPCPVCPKSFGLSYLQPVFLRGRHSQKWMVTTGCPHARAWGKHISTDTEGEIQDLWQAETVRLEAKEQK